MFPVWLCQTELDQAKLVSYLEDVENDILTDALNQATLAQVKGHINPDELTSLQDAIRVEEALQQVKTNRYPESRFQKSSGVGEGYKSKPTYQQVLRGGFRSGGVGTGTHSGSGESNGGWGWGYTSGQQVPTTGGGYKVLSSTTGGEHFNRCTLFCFVDRYCF